MRRHKIVYVGLSVLLLIAILATLWGDGDVRIVCHSEVIDEDIAIKIAREAVNEDVRWWREDIRRFSRRVSSAPKQAVAIFDPINVCMEFINNMGNYQKCRFEKSQNPAGLRGNWLVTDQEPPRNNNNDCGGLNCPNPGIVVLMSKAPGCVVRVLRFNS
jgi:hypothetical protein